MRQESPLHFVTKPVSSNPAEVKHRADWKSPYLFQEDDLRGVLSSLSERDKRVLSLYFARYISREARAASTSKTPRYFAKAAMSVSLLPAVN